MSAYKAVRETLDATCKEQVKLGVLGASNQRLLREEIMKRLNITRKSYGNHVSEYNRRIKKAIKGVLKALEEGFCPPPHRLS